MDSLFVGKDGFIWWKGVVEDRKDPIFLGRVRVRIFGWHTDDKLQLPTHDLPWAMPSLPIDNGRNPIGLKEGDWCWGFFLDGPEAQKPIVVGFIPGIDEDKANPEIGFYDPTPNEELKCDIVPRPPEMCPVQEGESKDGETPKATGRFKNPDVLPGQNIAFGELVKKYDYRTFKYDVNKDGEYNQTDANILTDIDGDGVPNNEKRFFSGQTKTSGSVAISRYPLEDRLMEPCTSRLTRNENIEKTIVALKKGELGAGEGGGYEGAGVGGDAAEGPAAFQEPETPYDAKYPYNHVYESESGHVIEVDDTPELQRMHWYHRSGTFTEIHPDGLEVNKVKKSQYNFIYEDYFNSTLKSINFDAGEAFRVKAGSVANINAGSDHNRQTGNDLNALVGRHINTRVKENTHTVIEEESWTHVFKGAFLYVKDDDGVLHIKVKKDILIESEMGKIQLVANSAPISLSSPQIMLQGPGGGLTDINLVSASIRSQFLVAHVAGVAFPAAGMIPDAPSPDPLLFNKAPDESWYEDGPTDASLKEGFLLPNGMPGDVWKPISESDKKLVTLSHAGQKHEIREALPTGQLEAVKIKYIHKDFSITEWKVVRPIHKPGDLIDKPKSVDIFEGDGRGMCRWSKPGAEYPKQVFFMTGSSENLILDSSQRHQCTFKFDEKIEGFNFKQTIEAPKT